MNHRKWRRDGGRGGVNNRLLMSIIVENRGSIWTLILSLSVRAASRQEERSRNGKWQNINSDWHQHPWMAVRDVITVKTLFHWSHSSSGMITSLISTWNDFKSVGALFTLHHIFYYVWHCMANYYFVSRQGSQWKALFEIVNNLQVLSNKSMMLRLTLFSSQDN